MRVPNALVLCATELRLIARNRTTAAMAVGLPLAIGAYLVVQQPDFGLDAAAVWPTLVTLQILALLGFTVYITTTSAFAARRQSLFLKRIRSGESSDIAIVAGVALPTVLLAVFQLAVLMAATAFAGATAPQAPHLLALAVVGGLAMCCAAGILTSCLTDSAEHAQFTTAPFFFALLSGGVVVARAAGDASLLQLAIPGGAVAELVHLAFHGGTAWPQEAFVAVGILAAWIAVPAVAARRLFRWAPRA